jgi:SP family arabinose:H+ symporter-like MFS transporter
MKMTAYLLKSTITGALGGLLFGFDTAVIAGTTQQLTVVYHLTSFTLGLTVSIGLAGTVLGAMTSGVIGQRIGGREALRSWQSFTPSQLWAARSPGTGLR